VAAYVIQPLSVHHTHTLIRAE